jgi:glycosyltransferase involved in cell wall biosynthesis
MPPETNRPSEATEYRMPGRRRVAFVVESGTDVRMVEGLASRCELSVVARRIDGGHEISQPPRAQFTKVVGPGAFAAFARFVFRWVLRERANIDVVVLQGYGPSALAGNLAATLIGVPAVMLVCSPVEEYYACRRQERTGRRYRRLEAMAIRATALLNARVGGRYVALSSYLASVIRSYGSRSAVDVIPVYGVDTSRFEPSCGTRVETRRRLRLPGDARLLFFSSRIAPEKDPDTLLAAVGMLRAEGRDVRIVHLSGGYQDFVRRATAHGLEAAVIAADAIPPFTRLAEWYQAADVCVQASREEGLGFSVLESLACGTPVVAAAVGGLRDTVRDGHTGWTYRAGDVQALVNALRSVLDNPEEGRRRALKGRELVLRSYEQGYVFDAFVNMLATQAVEKGLKAPQRAVAG